MQLEAVVGEPIVLELDANPTTGYDWEIEFDEGSLRLLDREFEEGGPGFGAAGRARYVFEALVPGQLPIKAVLKRAWEETPIEEKSFEVRAVPASPE